MIFAILMFEHELKADKWTKEVGFNLAFTKFFCLLGLLIALE
jgi:hypothetical protein